MQDQIAFQGTIAKITQDGSSAVVKLVEKTNGVNLAVISPDTKGRLEIIGDKGRLVEGQMVVGLARKGPDALRAFSVSLAKDANKKSAPAK